MKKVKIPTRDLKELSAYLDGQLTHRKAARFETRLKREPDLKAAYTKLQHTRSLLRAVPRLRSPRNFTLTPEMTGQTVTGSARFRPAYGLMSAVASLLFILVVSGDLMGIQRLKFEPAADQAAPSIALVQENEIAFEMEDMEAPAAEAEVAGKVLEVETFSGIEGATQDDQLKSGAEPDERTLDAEPSSAEESTTDVLESAPVVEAEEALIEEEPQPLMEAPPLEESDTVAKEAPVVDTPDGILSGEPDDTHVEGEILAEQPETPTGRALDEIDPHELADRPESGRETIKPRWPLVRWVETGLALVAAAAGILAWVQRRRF